MKKYKGILWVTWALITLIIVISGLKHFQFRKINDLYSDINTVVSINDLASNVNQLNYKAQINFWEYTYDPSKKNLLNLQTSKNELRDALKYLITSVEHNSYQEDASDKLFYEITNEGIQKVNVMIKDFENINNNWSNLILTINKIEQLKKEALTHEKGNELSSLQNQRLSLMTENIQIFNEIKFNKKIEAFFASQGKLIRHIRSVLDKHISLMRYLEMSLNITLLLSLISFSLFTIRHKKIL